MVDWAAAVGPFLDEAGTRGRTGLSSSELGALIVSNDILAVTSSDGVVLVPSFQFGLHGELLPGLRSVTALLRPVCDDNWDLALWLLAPSVDFVGGRSAVELLRDGEVEQVFTIAQRDGRTLDR